MSPHHLFTSTIYNSTLILHTTDLDTGKWLVESIYASGWVVWVGGNGSKEGRYTETNDPFKTAENNNENSHYNNEPKPYNKQNDKPTNK